ncbi:Protein FAM172A [Merluccius polli]|uniref:Protein FAM172A n=1 Tax=Merluccius polli TaxID=89951 RepID=A0AA47M1N5_MERPO|nr:Protein FAM172A [Merluccius polli]
MVPDRAAISAQGEQEERGPTLTTCVPRPMTQTLSTGFPCWVCRPGGGGVLPETPWVTFSAGPSAGGGGGGGGVADFLAWCSPLPPLPPFVSTAGRAALHFCCVSRVFTSTSCSSHPLQLYAYCHAHGPPEGPHGLVLVLPSCGLARGSPGPARDTGPRASKPQDALSLSLPVHGPTLRDWPARTEPQNGTLTDTSSFKRLTLLLPWVPFCQRKAFQLSMDVDREEKKKKKCDIQEGIGGPATVDSRSAVTRHNGAELLRLTFDIVIAVLNMRLALYLQQQGCPQLQSLSLSRGPNCWGKIDIVGRQMKQREVQVKHRVCAVALTDSAHNIWFQKSSKSMQDWMQEHCRNWVCSPQPLDAPVEAMLRDCPRVSAAPGADIMLNVQVIRHMLHMSVVTSFLALSHLGLLHNPMLHSEPQRVAGLNIT